MGFPAHDAADAKRTESPTGVLAHAEASQEMVEDSHSGNTQPLGLEQPPGRLEAFGPTLSG